MRDRASFCVKHNAELRLDIPAGTTSAIGALSLWR